MPGMHSSVYVTNILGLVGFLVLWIGFFECAKLLISLFKHDALIGWAIGPLGITTLYLREPSTPFILFNAIFPAVISGGVLYLGLFTAFPSPLTLPHYLLVEIPIIIGGVLLTSTGDFLNALRDLRYPLWGEARILRSIQFLRSSWASIHFTTFGVSYLRDRFDSNPTDLLQAF